MKKTLIALFGISIFAGAGYIAFAFTPLGKNVLSSWLLKRWEKRAAAQKQKLDKDALAKELAKLEYIDHELLFRYTLLLPSGTEEPAEKRQKQLEKLLTKMDERKLTERANLKQIENIVLPG